MRRHISTARSSGSSVANSDSDRYELRVDVLGRSIVIARFRVKSVRSFAYSYSESHACVLRPMHLSWSLQDLLAVTVPDVQVNPHQNQAGVQIVPGPTVTVFERLVERRYQPPPPMR